MVGANNELKTAGQKSAEVVDLYREKSKKLAQTEKLYDTLKKKVQAGEMETAASVDVNHTLNNIEGGQRPLPFEPMVEQRTTHHDFSDRGPRNFHGAGQEPIEQLHSHQKTGSSVIGHEQVVMPQFDHPRATRLRELFHRIILTEP